MRLYGYFLVVLIMGLTSTVYARQAHRSFCQNPDSTAATQQCLSDHLESTQSDLNKIYESAALSLSLDDKKELADLQAHWLDYRNKECAWEASQTENPSLQRLVELSCLSRLTENRARTLSAGIKGDESENTAHEYGNFSRLMAVLASEMPDIAWFHGNTQSMDLNCDGQDEELIDGITVSGDRYFIVANNPLVGRPTYTPFHFAMNDQNCYAGVVFDTVIPESEDDICDRYVSVQTQQCGSGKIIFTDKNKFEFIENPVEDLTLNQSKEIEQKDE